MLIKTPSSQWWEQPQEAVLQMMMCHHPVELIRMSHLRPRLHYTINHDRSSSSTGITTTTASIKASAQRTLSAETGKSSLKRNRNYGPKRKDALLSSLAGRSCNSVDAADDWWIAEWIKTSASHFKDRPLTPIIVQAFMNEWTNGLLACREKQTVTV